MFTGLQNYPAHSKFNTAKIHNKEGQCNFQPLVFRDCYNCLAVQVTIFLTVPLNLMGAIHSSMVVLTHT